MIIDRYTKMELPAGEAVRRAADNLKRDMAKILGSPDENMGHTEAGTECETEHEKEHGKEHGKGIIRLVAGPEERECFTLRETGGDLLLSASDELGFVYGICEISRRFLGVLPFWFWNDQKFIHRESIEIPSGFSYTSKQFCVKLRGWFINDEVLLHKWCLHGKKDAPWEMALETLLRLGGNMVIPGTDKNSVKYRSLASAMGLYITHHHAEPLGAEMFARAYPHLTPSYDQYPEKFEQLWREGIERQKDCKVVWNLGFRGQGDTPFWEHDPRYDTMESRGKLISSLIRKQYDMVKATRPDDICCTNLYGETMELYQKGWIDLPEDVIRIWADNGFGKMVSRRQGNHNPRVPSLPEKEDAGENGIYYHVSFYDLQAANHMTMLPNPPEFVQSELKEVLDRGADAYWIVNCSNVKPHTYYLDFIAQIWRDGEVDIEKHRETYFSDYYGGENKELLCILHRDYFKYALSYGPNSDDHAGEQFSNHVARILVHQFVTDRTHRSEDLLWATGVETLEEQTEWYQKLCSQAAADYGRYMRECEAGDALVSEDGRTLYRDTLMLQAQIHCECFTGAEEVCRAILAGLSGDYRRAFYYAGKAAKHYRTADAAMRAREHGKWRNFYENECLTDMKQTAWVLDGLMSYVRNLGDGPHYYQWQRDFLYAEEDRRVMLVMNMENHLTDQELFALMEEQWG